MNLYYVKAYHAEYNEWARFLVSAVSAEDAKQGAAASLSKDWRIREPRLICTTHDNVCTEL